MISGFKEATRSGSGEKNPPTISLPAVSGGITEWWVIPYTDLAAPILSSISVTEGTSETTRFGSSLMVISLPAESVKVIGYIPANNWLGINNKVTKIDARILDCMFFLLKDRKYSDYSALCRNIAITNYRYLVQQDPCFMQADQQL